MKFISSKVHGIVDYMFGALLIASPWLFGFADVYSARWVAVAMGAMAIVYSLLTRYELGVWRKIPFRVHLWLDYMSGALLALSPWFFGFADEVKIPHVVFGIMEILVPLFTQKHANVPGEDIATSDTYAPAHGTRSHNP
jgi:hypothetical protein